MLVTVDADGTVAVKETGDHLGRKGLEIGGGVGLVVGLFAPPLLAATVVGGAVGGVVGQVRQTSGRERPRGEDGRRATARLGRASSRSTTAHETDTVNTTLASAVRKSVAQVDGGGAKELKAALAQAQAGMSG